MGVDYQPLPQQEAPSATINLTDEPASSSSPTSVEKKMEALQTTLLEVHSQMRRSAIWVYYMILVQLVVAYYFYSEADLLFVLIVAMNLAGFAGVFKRNRVLISIHFGWTIGIQCFSWFLVFYTVLFNIMYSLLALAFCIIHIMGMKHERNLLALIAVAPVVRLERVAVQQEERKEQERSVELRSPASATPSTPARVEPVLPAMPTFVPSYGFYPQPFSPSPLEQQQQAAAAYYPSPATMPPAFFPPYFFPGAQQQHMQTIQQLQQMQMRQSQLQAQLQAQEQMQQQTQGFAPSPFMYYPPPPAPSEVDQ